MAGQTGKKNKLVYTIGHGTMSFEEFLSVLRGIGIQIVVDIRPVPKSKHVPHFNQDELIQRLPASGITYHHIKELSGRGRRVLHQSPNTGVPRAFRGYADYMLTEDFEKGVLQVRTLSALGSLVLLCSESDWRKSFRRFLADALLTKRMRVVHLDLSHPPEDHVLASRAEVKKDKVIYPAPGEQLQLF
jgi:uncharacterized protein (DUF488 family)